MTPSPAHVRWWLGRGPSPQEFRDLFVEPFNAGQNRVRIDLEVLTTAARERTIEALAAGTGPDIVMVPRAGDFVSLVAGGYLLDLTTYADRYGWSARLLAPALRIATVDGRLFGVPRSTETMMLLFNPSVLDGPAPRTRSELETAAARALSQGVIPFGAGCADFPESCELLWTLVVNHYAGPSAVRAALRGELPWTSPVFTAAIEQLRSWFDRGWFGPGYFTDSIEQGLDRVVTGTAAMSPAMTGMLPGQNAFLDAVPFPALRDGIPTPVYVFGTASLLGINAAAREADGAAHVLDALFQPQVRSLFGAHVPGDWNIPLADAEAAELTRTAPRIFAKPAIGVTEAVHAGRYGYATWSFLPPKTEALVVAHLRAVVEGTVTVHDHLAELQSIFTAELASGARPGLD